MARIVRPTAYGKPDVLNVFEAPVPEPGEGQVVVQVRAAGVNPIDWKLYSGGFHDVDEDHKDGAGMAADLPSLGLDCAGVVSAVGSGVTDVQVGAEVIVYPVNAAYADYVVAAATSLIPKPPSLGWAEAGSLMLSGTTAFHALQAAGVDAGDTVLVHGGAGGVGLMALQLAKGRGANVVATAAEQNHQLLRDLGAVPVTYGPGLLDRVRTAAPEGVTCAVDFVGSDEALDVSLELVQDRQRIASITGSDRRARSGIKCLGYGPGEDAGTEVRSEARGFLAEQAGAGALRVIVDATYGLDDVTAAHWAGINGHGPGKLVLIP